MTDLDRRRMLAGATLSAALLGTGARAQGTANPPQVQLGEKAPEGELIYRNPLKTAADIKGWVMEGAAGVDFDLGQMRMKNLMSADNGQASNFVFWCPEVFPDNVDIRWNFTALEEPGLCILFFAARGILPGGGDAHVLDPKLKPRAGVYDQYTKSDVSALQMAYFRRRWPEERAFHLCNLRRAPGFEMLAQAADPLPDVKDATPPYRVRLVKKTTGVAFYINDLKIIDWQAGSPAPQPKWPGAGSLGFRQMAPLVAAYSDLEVRKLA
jgi:hypothetical protein